MFAVDGSRVNAPQTRRNERALACAGRIKTQPQRWITRLVHLPTAMMWNGRQGPGTSAERDHLRAMIPSLPPWSLLAGDIGFGGFDLLRKLSRSGVSFLIRCGGNTTQLVENTRQSIERKGDIGWVYLWPRNRGSKTPLRLLFIVFKHKPQCVYLLTHVEKQTQFSRSMASEFCRGRWKIELFFHWFKGILGCRHWLRTTYQGMTLQVYLAVPASLLISLRTGRKLTKRTFEMIYLYLQSWASAEALTQDIESLKKSGSLWRTSANRGRSDVVHAPSREHATESTCPKTQVSYL